MTKYIVNLTNDLIRRLSIVEELSTENREEFIKEVAMRVEILEVDNMRPQTLGKIMCSFEKGDVMASKEELFTGVFFAGDPGTTLRALVAQCLAHAIWERLTTTTDEAISHIPRYKPGRNK